MRKITVNVETDQGTSTVEFGPESHGIVLAVDGHLTIHEGDNLLHDFAPGSWSSLRVTEEA